MQATRIVEAVFNGGRAVTTRKLYQYDYGQIITFPDLTVPTAYQVQFCSIGDGTTLEVIGNADGVAVPDELLQRGQLIMAYVFLHDTDSDGETRYTIAIPVAKRPEMSDIAPTPEEQREIDQLISALNDGVTRSETAATDAALSADAAADSAEAAAGSATTAQLAAGTAQAAADAASMSASQAAASEASASTSAGSAWSSAADAAQSADRAEQAAATAGYMSFYIDENGDLIYVKTPNTEADFYLDDGDLYVRATA